MEKSRGSLAAFIRGQYELYDGSSVIARTDFDNLYINREHLITFSHRWPPRPGDKRLDIGGPFTVRKNTMICTPKTLDVKTGANVGVGRWHKYTGTHIARNVSPSSSFLLPTSLATLNALGATGIRRTIPTNPLSSMGQFLGELRDLPTVPDIQRWRRDAKKFLDLSKRGSNEYLNVQFGWIPFIKDLRDFYFAARNAEKHIAQYRRDSGRAVRRRTTVVNDTQTDPPVQIGTATAVGYPALNSAMFETLGRLYEQKTTTRKVWFSGAYTYYLPEPGNFISRAREIEAFGSKLFGLRITPSLIWELAPWSWAIDWRYNIGDVIHNWSAFQNDGLVLRYGYVMEHRKISTTHSLIGAKFRNGQGDLDSFVVINQEVKTRHRATPYGFGLNPSSFSARQWSIIAALGISRMPRAL